MDSHEYKLSEISNMKYGKMLSKDKFTDTGYPVYSGYRVTGYTDEFLYEQPMVVVVARGVGGTGDVKISPPKSWITNLSIVLETDNKLVDKYYLYCMLNQERLKDKLDSGASISQITISTLDPYLIRLPPIDKQNQISNVLKSYDNLIENNNRRIAILEDMAQSLYREWFVHFRFPGHEDCQFKDSELGRIPERWEVKLVSDLIKRKTAGAKYKQDNVKSEGNVTVIDQSRNEFLGYHNNAPDHEASAENPIAIFGDHTCKMQLMVEPFSVGPNVVPFVPKLTLDPIYIFFLVESLVETKEYKRHWTELNAKSVVVADKEIANSFSELINPLLKQINTLKNKNITLRKSRDLILPKIISGDMNF